jgi:hypothetical protein
MPAYRIRLAKPWSCSQEGGRWAWRRKFGHPAGLESGDRLFLVFGGLPGPMAATLNGTPLGAVGEAAESRLEVTDRLRRRNELQLIATNDAGVEGIKIAPPFQVCLEIVPVGRVS